MIGWRMVMNNNKRLHDFINLDDNDSFSKMSGLELQHLIALLDDYLINYRYNIGIRTYSSFGIELEFEAAQKGIIGKYLSDNFGSNEWNLKSDLSLFFGAEISSPILFDKTSDWNDLASVCNFVSNYGEIDKSCGGHVHIGAHLLGNNAQNWLNFMLLWSVYENVLYRFSFNEYLKARPNAIKYAKPVADLFWQNYVYCTKDKTSLDGCLDRVSKERNQAVNFLNAYKHLDNIGCIAAFNTVEFRGPNGTFVPALWQNKINTFSRVMCYASNKSSFDEDLIMKRKIANDDILEGLSSKSYLKIYEEIFIDQALEFCDLIFDNNLDKLNFLKQYFKSFETYKKNVSYPKVKKRLAE